MQKEVIVERRLRTCAEQFQKLSKLNCLGLLLASFIEIRFRMPLDNAHNLSSSSAL